MGLTDAERRRLKLQAQEYRLAIETASDGFWVTDLQGRLLEVNAAYAAASGYSHDALLGLRIQDLDAFDSSQEVGLRMEKIIQTGHARFVSAHRARDGRRWPVEMVVSYSPMDGGRFFCFTRDLTEQQKSAELIWHQANFDHLTDLPNRALFFDRLSQECSAVRRNGKQVALLYADLDAFKPVNDRFGHAAGDAVLQTVAARWQDCVRGTDTIARLGGDEFAIIAGHLESRQEAAAIADKLIEALRPDIALPTGQACSLGVSIGIAIYPDNAVEMDSLLSAADAAMFACKTRGKNAYAFSDAQAQASGERANWIDFQDAYLVGVAEIDAQHRQLIRMVNELNQELSARSSEGQISKGFEALLAFTLLHFQTEHRYMLAHGYADTAAHDFEHGQLANQLRLLLDRHQHTGDFLVLQKLKDWLLSHIQISDQALGRSLRERGVT
jgi:diguanylate cyclase (GGDEF)-like protein/hemerythrin-like metal-binding protein/PAS domain S-box-containing protein